MTRRRRRVFGSLWAAAALALLAGGPLILTMPYVTSQRDLRAYRHAAPCPVTGLPGTDCRRYLEAVVRRVQIDDTGRGGHYAADLSGPAPAAGRLALDDDDPVLSRLEAGDRLTVEIWRGRRTAITAFGQVQPTSESPLDAPSSYLSIGVASCLLGLLAADFALRQLNGRLHRRWSASQGVFSTEGKVLGVLTLTALIGGGVLSSTQETASGMFFMLWAAVATLAGGIWGIATTHRRRRR